MEHSVPNEVTDIIEEEISASETDSLIDSLTQRGLWLDENIESLADHSVSTYKYAILSAASIIFVIAFFTAATALYKKRNGSGQSSGSGKGDA